MKRVIEMSTRGMRLSLHEKRIEISREGVVYARIVPEDLSMVILGSSGLSISSGAIQVLSRSGVAILTLDENHLPVGLFLPLWSHSTQSERFRLQIRISEPMKKNLWTLLVTQKIRNQARMLSDLDRRILEDMASRVKSDDVSNMEAQAARHYWPRVFAVELGCGFIRHREGVPPNTLLNYGYAILRAATARALCVAGLQPTLGLHHHNRYSSFCLADDLMEPFRPYVDRIVLQLISQGKNSVTQESKRSLLGVLSCNVTLGKEHFLLEHMIEKTASSLACCIEQQVKHRKPVATAVRSLQLPDGWPECH